MFTSSGKTAWISILLCILSGCASSRQPGDKPVPRATRDEVANVQRALETAYERERALADRLHRAEAEGRQLRVRLEELQVRLEEVERRVKQTAPVASAPTRRPVVEQVESAPGPKPTPAPELTLEDEVEPASETNAQAATPFDELAVYKAALENYYNRRFETAMDQFAQILVRAPQSERADNAQYWIGEYLFSVGRHRQALAEFAKVFNYAKTEKADDAQFMSARCYLAMGEAELALKAFQRILDEYPNSEYVAQAKKEMNYIKGP